MANNLQMSGQAERPNKMITVILERYVEEHQRDWQIYVQPLEYVQIAKMYCSKASCLLAWGYCDISPDLRHFMPRWY